MYRFVVAKRPDGRLDSNSLSRQPTRRYERRFVAPVPAPAPDAAVSSSGSEDPPRAARNVPRNTEGWHIRMEIDAMTEATAALREASGTAKAPKEGDEKEAVTGIGGRGHIGCRQPPLRYSAISICECWNRAF